MKRLGTFMAMQKRQVVPSFLTSMNLLCGFLSLLINEPITSFYLILIAIAFDFVDGLSARLLKVPSAFGKELDSLADMVSFGVAPGFLYYHHVFTLQASSGLLSSLEYFIATLIPVLAALRLAKFNVKDGGKIGFEGLPSSAAALAIISIPFLMAQENTIIWQIADSSIFYAFIFPLIMALLMVSKLPMFNFKQLGKGLQANGIQLIYLLSIILLAIVFKDNIFILMPVAIIWYILLSLLTVKIWKK